MSATLKPGWNMTEDQHRRFWRLWRAVCKYREWTGLSVAELNERRHAILLQLGFTSAKEIDSGEGFDSVRLRLEALAGKVHNDRPDAGRRRRLLWLVDNAIFEMRQAKYPAQAIETILRVRFKVIDGVRTIADLETAQLLPLIYTLKSRLKTFRQLQVLVGIMRGLMVKFALYRAWPSPLPGSQPAPVNVASMAHASAMQPIFSAIETDLQPLFFVFS